MSPSSSLGVSSTIGTLRNAGSFRKKPNRLSSDVAVADVLMAVDTRAQVLLRVVEMEPDDRGEPEARAKLLPESGIPLRSAVVVARSQQVTGVETDPEPSGIPRLLEQELEVL